MRAASDVNINYQSRYQLTLTQPRGFVHISLLPDHRASPSTSHHTVAASSTHRPEIEDAKDLPAAGCAW